LRIEFTGWLEGAQLTRAFGKSDLLVVPSLWPEPFGLVGPEAGLHGLPAAAFDAGGISDWLTDGVNGYLASGHPPSPNGLAQAIVKCLNDPANYQRLRQGAVASSSQFSLRRHVVNLLGLFERVIGNRTTYSGFR
jgi:glycosyltransferase involved in cell wall biosynthesis